MVSYPINRGFFPESKPLLSVRVVEKKHFVAQSFIPQEIPVLASNFACIFDFKDPLPLGISNDLPQGGYDFFLELTSQCKQKNIIKMLAIISA